MLLTAHASVAQVHARSPRLAEATATTVARRIWATRNVYWVSLASAQPASSRSAATHSCSRNTRKRADLMTEQAENDVFADGH
uniref:Uncharacterized protein n=1 Tax=Arundo donax TaxID=35708 RepID=A0A0A9B862_ARUDO